MRDDDEKRRVVLVRVHRGQAAKQVLRTITNDEHELVVACFSAKPGRSYALRRRIGTSTIFHVRGKGGKVVLELREVDRLWWPA